MHTALPRTVEAFEALCAELSNWQRWDAEDELGTLNLLSAERIAAAGRLVERGAVFSLALPLGEDGPHRGATRRFNPLHLLLRDGADEASGAAARDFNTRDLDTGFADDIAILPLQAGTHWDALSHCMYKGVMYGGRDAALVSSRGAPRHDIMGASRTLVGRGVLLAPPRARAVPWLEGGAAITGADLAECARAQGADVLPGDVLLVRTGRLARAREEGWGDYADPFAAQPGIGVEAAAWLHEHDLAALA